MSTPRDTGLSRKRCDNASFKAGIGDAPVFGTGTRLAINVSQCTGMQLLRNTKDIEVRPGMSQHCEPQPVPGERLHLEVHNYQSKEDETGVNGKEKR